MTTATAETAITTAQGNAATALEKFNAALALIGDDNTGADTTIGTPNDAAAKDNLVASIFSTTALGENLTAALAALEPPPPPPASTAAIGNWNNGAVLPIKTSIVHDYADTPEGGAPASTYGYDAARTAQQAGKRLMLNVGPMTTAEATAVAQTLKANGQGAALIVYPWEMNQNNPGWYPTWNQLGMTAAEFIATCVTIHEAFTAVSEEFEFVWCKAAGDSPNAPGRTAYDTVPVGHVDYLAMDLYDTFGSVAGAQAAITDLVSHADALEVPWGICELGSGGTDDAAFWTMVYDESEDGACAFMVFFAYKGATSGQGADLTLEAASLAVIDADF